MVVRELKDGRAIVATQEDHAELAAQFAAHWGNERFSQLRPYKTMVFATTFHDSGYREFEGNPPIDAAKGRPYAHREDVPNFEATELAAYCKNAEWVSSHDPYAGLIVSMHRTGLWHNRYNVFTEPAGRRRERSLEVQAAKKDLEAKQEKTKQELAAKMSWRIITARCKSTTSFPFTSVAMGTRRKTRSRNIKSPRCESLMTAPKPSSCASSLTATACASIPILLMFRRCRSPCVRASSNRPPASPRKRASKLIKRLHDKLLTFRLHAKQRL